MQRLNKILLSKSQESFLLALELYNKPTISYRAESFSILFSNAWELLLKAYILKQNSGKRAVIFRKKQKGKKRESLSLDECLNKVFLNVNDPVRKNIEYISEIRNEAAHLIIQELDPYFSRAFQVGVINYIDQLLDWFAIDLNKRLNPGLVSLISNRDKVKDIASLKSKFNKEDFDVISSWIKKFNELEKLGDKAVLSIEHTVAIVKNPKNADYVISAGDNAKEKVAIIQKTKNPDTSHPFNRKSAIAEIKKNLPRGSRFNEYDFEAYVYCKGYKKTSNNDYYYKGRYSGAGQYSQQFIDECIQEIKTSENLLSECKARYKKYLTRKKSR